MSHQLILVVNLADITTHIEESREEGYDHADQHKQNSDGSIPDKMVGDVYGKIQLIVEQAHDADGEECRNQAAKKTVQHCASDERARDETHLGPHHTHGTDSVALSIERDAYGAANQDDAEQNNETDEKNQEPRHLIVYLVQLGHYIFLIGDLLNARHLIDVMLELRNNSTLIVRNKVSP